MSKFTNEQKDASIKSLQWIVVMLGETEPATFEYTVQMYVKRAIEIIEASKNDSD